MANYPAELEERWDGAGEPLVIRPIRPDDAARHDAFFHRLLPEDIRFRFFAAIRELSAVQLARFTQLDYDHDMALVAVREGTGETVGVARLARGADPSVAEFAVVVQHDMQGHGLAVHLMRRLFDWARGHGIREIVGEILADNEPMLHLARLLGFTLRHRPTDAVIIEARLMLVPADPAQNAA